MRVIEHIQERLSIFKNLYDIIRVVDPVTEKALVFKDGEVEELQGTCYGFWNKNESCSNCISMKAFLKDETFIKIEYTDDKTYVITAIPITYNEKTYVVEIIKDISISGTIIDNRSERQNLENLLSDMNEKIVKDEITGIFNRRYINEKLPIEITNSIVGEYPLSVIMADIDFFKDVNDNYGHLTGDKILRDFATLIDDSIRRGLDWVGRYGGEEFLIVLKNTNPENATKVAEKIRITLENTTFTHEGKDIKITSSFGVFGFKNKKLNLDDLISRADKNLYVAKTSGRNKTIVDL